jgi:hypothetical protein
VVLCSYQFARAKEPYLRQTPWDLVVIDEAHRLRNVYKATSKIAVALKQALAPFPKILLTATPLQNSLLELYGLVSIIDEYTFGDLHSYRARFARPGNDTDFFALKERLKPLCKRTLRRQVLEYVKYTNRHALVQEFVHSTDEQRLYDGVSTYLQRPTLYALPASQRQLVTLILRKLPASSSYAIAGTLDSMVRRLEATATATTMVDTLPDDWPDHWEELDEMAEEWEEENDTAASAPAVRLTPEQLTELKREMEELRAFLTLARAIVKNAKGEVLLTALRRGLAAAADAQRAQPAAVLQPKALIFTESRRTQEYLCQLLEHTEFRGKVMRFNGSNNDPLSRAIYRRWLAKHAGTDRVTGSPSADMRAALVEYFRDEATIMIATEAAAEGMNLQFCNLVVNYDHPWNPQRIEQRIGRCHRYGQKFDVVVVNFLNKHNAADQRVYQLLDEKFRLFHGVFGASDEVLGAVESGVDFEKRIAAIYQRCRTPEQIQFEFDQLQRELETEDRLVFAGCTDDGMPRDETPCRRLFDLPAQQEAPCSIPPATAAALDAAQERRRQALLEETTTRNGHWFDTEMDKLDRWAEDRCASLRAELAELDEALKDAKKAARLAPTLPEKLERQRAVRALETRREEAWRAYDHPSREIDAQKDALLDTISQRLTQHLEHEPLFTLHWQLV